MHRLFHILALFCWIGIFGYAEGTEPPPRKLRFFNLDLHISVIADVKNIFESMGHEVVNWSISGHTWVFGKPIDVVDVVNERTWQGLNKEMCDRFYERYKDFLSQFDGFIVAYPTSFALLYEKFNKPIIIVIATRYEAPFTRNPENWSWLNEYLKDGIKNNKIFIVSNNKGDSNYLRYYTGIETDVIPSLCLYTHAQYTGTRREVICHAYWGDARLKSDWSRIYSKLGSFTSLPRGYAWQDLYNLQGIVHIPYQISTMSLFEHYSANIPLFFPTKEFLLKLHTLYPDSALNSLSFLGTQELLSKPRPVDDLNNVLNTAIIKCWIDWADYYDPENMPYIQYFDSFEELGQLLQTVNYQEISQKMKEYNKIRKAVVFKKWQDILKKVLENCD